MTGHNGAMGVFSDLLETHRTLLVDGAMGTELFARGLTAGDPPEMWNVDMPERVTSVHAGYIEAGSDIILTNSFGGTSFRLKLHNLADRFPEKLAEMQAKWNQWQKHQSERSKL